MFRLVLAATLAMSAMTANAATVSDKKDVAAAIIAMERSALDGSDRGDIDRFLGLSAPGVVYMDPGLEQPIVGIEDLTAYYRKVFKPEAVPSVAGEMLHSHVQVMGDTAVLTFNYVVKKLDGGAVVRRWNATEVYNRSGGTWRIVNTHWSFTQPKLAEKTP
jgi:ketosteroid isomerase-like protein